MTWFTNLQAKLRTMSAVQVHLTATVTIVRRTAGTENDYGFVTDTETTSTTTGALTPLSTQDSADIHAGREGEMSYYKLIVPYAADIRAEDQVTISGTRYDVVQLSAQQTTAIYKTAIIQRLD